MVGACTAGNGGGRNFEGRRCAREDGGASACTCGKRVRQELEHDLYRMRRGEKNRWPG
jgi:hypothetical protein